MCLGGNLGDFPKKLEGGSRDAQGRQMTSVPPQIAEVFHVEHFALEQEFFIGFPLLPSFGSLILAIVAVILYPSHFLVS